MQGLREPDYSRAKNVSACDGRRHQHERPNQAALPLEIKPPILLLHVLWVIASLTLILDASAWDEPARCFGPDKSWLIDQCVGREKLERGGQSPIAGEASPTKSRVLGRVTLALPPSDTTVAAQTLKAARVLAQQSISDGEQVELIAAPCKHCFASCFCKDVRAGSSGGLLSQTLGLIFWTPRQEILSWAACLQDRNQPTAEYWLRAFCRHAEKIVDKSTPEHLPADLCLFAKFVASKIILPGPHFANRLKNLKTKTALFTKPSLVDNVGIRLLEGGGSWPPEQPLWPAPWPT